MINNITPVVLVSNDEYWLPYVLSSVKGTFSRYVIYDVGSTDLTKEVIDWFISSLKDNETYVVRKLPMCLPLVQGTFRNSMIAECESDWYFILDGDEIYTKEGISQFERVFNVHKTTNKEYGVFKRIEINSKLRHKYEDIRSHHRVYHRTAYWKGPHPGEEPVITQTSSREYYYGNVFCYHMHNAVRSRNENLVPGRLTRKHKKTYHTGNLIPFNLLEEVPLLRKKIEEFPVCPDLEVLQNEWWANIPLSMREDDK